MPINAKQIYLVKEMRLVIYVLIIFTVISRLLPHTFNFTSVGALSLFAGAFLPMRYAWSVPVFCLVVSDAVTGFYHPLVMLFVYLGFLTNTFVGQYFLQYKRNVLRITTSGLVAAFIFYIISNFGMWISELGYPLTINGIIECYINGLPYLKITIAANILYSYFLFGTYQLIYLARYKSNIGITTK